MALDNRPRNAGIGRTLDANTSIEGTLDANIAIERTLGTDAAIKRVLDTNILMASVVKQTLSRRVEPTVTAADVRTYLVPITQALRPLQIIIEDRSAYPWRIRWKAIYLLVDIVSVLPRPLTGFKELQSLIDRTSDAARSYVDENAPAPRKWMTEPVPHDWRVKRDELKICGLGEAIERLARRKESTKGVYSWIEPGNIPYLSLYPQRTRYDPTSRSYWLLEKLERWAFWGVGSGRHGSIDHLQVFRCRYPFAGP